MTINHSTIRRAQLAASVALATICLSCGTADDTTRTSVDDSRPVAAAQRSHDAGSAVSAYAASYNDGDIDGIVELFAPNAVISGHPYADRVEGHLAIRTLQLRDMSNAAQQTAYVMSDIRVDDDVVWWNHRYTNRDGDQWCALDNRAVVRKGRIEQWDFSTQVDRCVD